MGTLSCLICNNSAEKSTFQVNPIDFFFIDQKIYNPNGVESEGYKALPLCKKCYVNLQRGQSFIKNYLDFSISNTAGSKSSLRFWLIPNIGDPSKVDESLTDIKKGKLGIGSVKYLCESLENIQEQLAEDILDESEDIAQHLMTFNALFYHKDNNGHMRIIYSKEGIYPQRLRELTQIAKNLNKTYPYFLHNIKFSFTTLIEFWATTGKAIWQKELAELLGSIFLKNTVSNSYIYSVLMDRLRNVIRGPKISLDISKLEEIKTMSLKAMMILEFLEMSGVTSLKDGEYSSTNLSLNDKLVSELQKFLNSHSKLLKSGTMRAICCTGAAYGIVLVEQKRNIGSTSLWSRLNRLELDAERLIQLLPLAMNKLKQYKVDKYDNLMAYIAASEVSNMDIQEAKTMDNNLLNLAFTVGLGLGYTLANLANNDKKEEDTK